MKAVVIYEAGGVDKLVYQDVETPTVKPGWSLVKVMGFGINRSEIFTRQGYSESVRFPRILGIECVGIVAVSMDRERIPEGTKVVSIMGEMGRAFDGSYAEYVLLPNEQIYKVQTHLDWPIMAAVPETYHTGFWHLEKFENRKLRCRPRTWGCQRCRRGLCQTPEREIPKGALVRIDAQCRQDRPADGSRI